MADYLLGLDIGTTSTKGILLHPEAGITATAEAEATLTSPQAGWAEADPGQWWANVATVSRACLAQAGVRPDEVAGIGVSGMLPTVILLDKAGRALYPSIQQNDARAVHEIDHLRGLTDADDVLARTGSPITQQSVGPTILWLQAHQEEVMNQAAHLMGSYDYIVYRMTGAFSCERNWALESGLFDLYRQDWDENLLTLSRIERDWLGEVHWPSDLVGQLNGQAAAQTGLREGTPVVAGSADMIASAFSAGLKSPGDMLIKLGGAGDILYCLDEPMVDPRLYLDYHVEPGKYLINGCMAASGSILKWFKGEFGSGLDFPALDAEGETVPPGSGGLILLPYFLGEKTPLNDPLARGVFFGLTLHHTRAHLYRAILEGIAYGFMHHLVVLAERGLGARRARVTNGGARSKLWKRITADVLGLPLEQVADHPGSSLGTAFVAGMGVGLFTEWGQIERFIKIDEVIEPDPGAQARYERLFPIYREVYESLKDQFPLLRQAVADDD